MRLLTESETALASDLYRVGKPVTQIARILGTRTKTVSNTLGIGWSYAPKPNQGPQRPEFDRICNEINGCVPSGGCRYPECECKGKPHNAAQVSG